MHSQQPSGVVQNWSALQCNKQNTEQCGDDHAPVTRGRMRAQYPLPHGPGYPGAAGRPVGRGAPPLSKRAGGAGGPPEGPAAAGWAAAP